MSEFDKLARQVNAERNQEWHDKAENRRLSGEDIYIEYLVYCNCYDTPKDDYKAFYEWLATKTDYKLTFWQTKHLKEKYFGYKYIYDNEKQKWSVEKL